MKMKWLVMISVSLLIPVTSAVADSHETPAVANEAKDASKTENKKNKSNVGEISIKDVQDALAKKEVTVIDANGIAKYNNGHLPGALNFASTDPEALAKALPEDRAALIVVYCGGPT